MSRTKPDLTGMSFREIAAKYGEEVAIEAGVAADPDAAPLMNAEDFRRMRPAAEVLPDLVARYKRSTQARGAQNTPTEPQISVQLDADLVDHFRKSGQGWLTRLNATLRAAVSPGVRS